MCVYVKAHMYVYKPVIRNFETELTPPTYLTSHIIISIIIIIISAVSGSHGIITGHRP